MSRQRTQPSSKSSQQPLCAERKLDEARGRKAKPSLPFATSPCAIRGPVTLSPDATACVDGAVTAPLCLPTEPLGRAWRGAVRGPADTHSPLPTPKPACSSHLLPLPLHCGCHTVTRTSVTISSSGSSTVPDMAGDPRLLTEGINAFK